MSYGTYLVSLPKEGDFYSNRPLLSNIYKLGLKRDILIKGPKQAGLSSLALEITQDFLEAGFLVVFFDYQKTIRHDRLEGFIDNPNFIWIEPYSTNQIKEVLMALKGVEKVAVVFDGSYYIYEDYVEFKSSPNKLKSFVNSINPNCSLVVTDSNSKDVGFEWSEIIRVSKPGKAIKNKNNQKIGHVVKVSGSLGVESLFVMYSCGRISKRWLSVWPSIVKGEKTLTSIFSGEKGLWNYISNET